MSPFSYDEFKSDNIKFENEIGKVVEGQILEIERYQGMNGPCPRYQLLLSDGRRASLIASQTDLKQKLAEGAPQIGDRIRIEYVEDKNVGQPQPMKIFRVGVTSGQTAAPVAAAPDSPATQAGAQEPF